MRQMEQIVEEVGEVGTRRIRGWTWCSIDWQRQPKSNAEIDPEAQGVDIKVTGEESNDIVP